MAPDENEELEGLEDFNESELDSTISDDDDDLEAQMAATMAAEGLDDSSDEDDLEAQMAAAMATELGDSDESEDDLEAQMAAAMGGDDTIDESLLGALGGGADGDDIDVKPAEFKQLKPSDEVVDKDSIDRLMDVSLSLSVELGRKQMQIRDILDLGPGKIIELDKLAGEPVDILVNGKLLAKGEVVVVDENFGVRITDLISTKDRVRSLR